MRVLLLGSHMNYNLEDYVYMNLAKLGHEVKFYGYREKLGKLADLVRMAITRSKLIRDVGNLLWLNRANDEIKKMAEAFSPDLVLAIKGEAVKPETIEWISKELGSKTALWYPDDPRFFNSLVKYIAPAYEYIFTASERAISNYERLGCENVYFLQFACEETVHKRMSLTEEEKRKYGTDVVFVGAYNTFKRARLIKALKKAGIQVKVYGPYWKYFERTNSFNGIYGPEMVKAFNAAKIVLNIHIEDDIPYKVNMRTFEATGCGAFLLTDNAYGIDKMFKVGKELVVYTSESELVELASRYLDEEGERLKISDRGEQRARSEHSYRLRVEQILNMVG